MENGKLYAVLVELKKGTPVEKEPKFNQYFHERIRHLTPCTSEGGRFRSWETGKEVKIGQNTLVWPVYPGTAFKFKDGTIILVSRKANGELFLEQTDFNPTSMVLVEAK